MNSIVQNVKLVEFGDPKFVIPYRINYTENGYDKSWEMVKVHASVMGVVYNKNAKKLAFVRQFRPAVYVNSIPHEEWNNIDAEKYPKNLGITIEFCAGLADVEGKTLQQVMQSEVLEEIGYDVPLKNITLVSTFRSGVGVSGEHIYMYYVEVTDDMRVSAGGGVKSEGEFVEVIELRPEAAFRYLHDKSINISIETLYGLHWWRSEVYGPELTVRCRPKSPITSA